jgi:hypothetical protein
MQKCAKAMNVHEIVQKYDKTWDSVKMWDSLSKHEKMCQNMRKCVKTWKLVSEHEKVCQNMR